MSNPLIKTALRCLLGFVLLVFGALVHSQLFVILAILNFALAGAWLWIEQRS